MSLELGVLESSCVRVDKVYHPNMVRRDEARVGCWPARLSPIEEPWLRLGSAQSEDMDLIEVSRSYVSPMWPIRFQRSSGNYRRNSLNLV